MKSIERAFMTESNSSFFEIIFQMLTEVQTHKGIGRPQPAMKVVLVLATHSVSFNYWCLRLSNAQYLDLDLNRQ